MNRPHASDTISDLINRRLDRRSSMKGMLALVGGAAVASCLPGQRREATAQTDKESTFAELPHLRPNQDPQAARTIAVAEGHRAQVLLKWGDPVTRGAPRFEVDRQTAQKQEQQFGYNNDFVAYLPLPRGSQSSEHGLLCVNHEYTNSELMFPGLTRDNALEAISDKQIRVEMAAHGHSVVEIRQHDSRWEVVRNSRLNRRLSALSTVMKLSGPAAGHPRLKTSADPTGTRVIGTLNNCAGGVTPWGTILTAEENFHTYFRGDPTRTSEAANHTRYGVGSELYSAWHRLDRRFDIEQEPHEPNRFGWVVEFDPHDPQSVPVKRTALGRIRHEGTSISVNRDGRIVVYMGDDDRFEYLFKFVTSRPYDPQCPEANADLLDDGTLYTARFNESGTVRWLPLVYGNGPLTAKNGFRSQADVVIETRRAASLLGATPMDRPEDVEENPGSGRVYVMLTNNTQRSEELVDMANPRAANRHGHILELLIPGADGKWNHAATEHGWNVFLRAGNWEDGDGWYQGAHPPGWLSCPDNCAFDARGRLWIATDGAQKAAGILDGLYTCETTGPHKAVTRHFFRGPIGSEICGPCFTPDGSTLFVSVQHPGEGSTFDKPSTRWPHPPASKLPPQPAVVAITREGGGAVGC